MMRGDREFDPARDHGRYILDTDGRTPIPCDDLLEWDRWLKTHLEERRVGHDVINLQYEVSTMFLGLDANITRAFHARPILFETAVFRLAMCVRIGMSKHGGRWATWDEAEREHARIVAELRKTAAG